MNDAANRQLLSHANEKYVQAMRDQDLSIFHRMLSLQLREKYANQRELELLKLQVGEGNQMTREYVDEVKFIVAFLLVCHLLMAFVYQQDWIFYVSPAYFLLVLFSLK